MRVKIIGDNHGCNSTILYLKEHLKLGASISLRSGRSGSIGCSETKTIRDYILLNKFDKFVECGIKCESGQMVSEFFLYQEIIEQSPLISQ